jgi:uncharacterized protein
MFANIFIFNLSLKIPTMPKTTLTAPEAAIVAVICFGLFIGLSLEAVLAGFPEANFSDTGNAWMIGMELVLTATALLYLKARNFDIRSLYPYPTLAGTALGIALLFACWILGTIATALFSSSTNIGVIGFSFAKVTLTSTVALALVNGTFEEVFLLGVLTRGLRGYGLSVALAIPLLVRVLYHLYQGPIGAVWVTTVGATLTLAFVLGGKLWPPVFAHIL